MSGYLTPDEELVRRLPLPLAQLHRRAHDAKTPLERVLVAYYLWEASLKLLGSVAIVAYAERSEHDPVLTERLTSLARPALGNWWEYVRLLVPALADAGDEPFRAVRDLVLGSSRSNLPRAAALDAALREFLGGAAGAHSTVRVSDLFERLVQYRNKTTGHGVMGVRPSESDEQMGRAILAGVGELLGHLDVLAGYRLVYVSAVERAEDGAWVIERLALTGEAPRSLKPVERPEREAHLLPLPKRVYLDAPVLRDSVEDPPPPEDPGKSSLPARPDVLALRSVHPMVKYDPAKEEMFFLNARRGRSRIEYLGYISGAIIDRPDLGAEHRALLARVLGCAIASDQVAAWADQSVAGEPQGSPSPNTDEPPPRRLGEFELLSVLGRGGMGKVYRAWQPSLGRQVALKCLLRVGDPKAEARFDREIHALGKVEHPSVVKVFTSGVDGDQWFYAMELAEGATLAALCRALHSRSASAAGLDLGTWRESLSKACEDSRKEEQSLSDHQATATRPAPSRADSLHPSVPTQAPARQGYVKEVAELVRQVAQAAHALHQAGVIHRDIKPGNVVVTADGTQAVLMDLGLAQLVDELDKQNKPNLTTKFVGTLRYSSPEQILDSAKVDRRTDVYSLGAVLWELLTLRALYGASESTPDYLLQRQIVLEEPKRVRTFHPGIPRDLEAIVAKCLEKKPDHRYATAADLAGDLRHFLVGEPVKARPVGSLGRTLRWARRRPLPAAMATLGCLLVSLVLGAGFAYWDFHRERIEYYRDFEKRWGIPVGIGRLTAEQAHHRQYTLQFHRRAGRVERVDVVNGHGQLTTRHPVDTYIGSRDDATQAKRECSYIYRFDEKGQLTEERALDRSGGIVFKFIYTSEDSAHFTDARGSTFAVPGSEASFVRFELSDRGLAKEIKFYDINGNARRPNRDGIYGKHQEFDAHGWWVRMTFLGPHDQPVLSRDGFAGLTAKYDDAGNLIEQAYLNESGQPVRSKYGYAKLTILYDDWGNRIETAYLDDAGEATRNKDGYAKITARYDDRGHLVEEKYFDGAGQPTLTKGGYAKVTAQYDECGNAIEFAYFDKFGRPARHKDGYAKSTARYNERGQADQTAYFDESGRPTRHKDGHAKFTARYNERGQADEAAYFDESGRPTRHKNGYAKLTAKYDDRGNRIEEAHFDEAGKPLQIKDGCAKFTAKYDDQGNRIEEAYFNEAGKPVQIKGGYAKFTAKFDGRGNRIEEAYFDEAGKPVQIEGGYAKFTAKYDDQGNRIEEAYFDESGKPVQIKGGYAKFTLRYDERGNRIQEAYFDESGKPVETDSGFAKSTASYDARGNRTETSFFDESGMPVQVKDGFAKITNKYDDRGNFIDTAYFDVAGKPVQLKDGFARFTIRYDDRDNRIEEVYFDAAGRPTRHKDGYTKFAAEYDHQDHQIEQAYFDETGKPVRFRNEFTRVTMAYDEKGRKVRQAIFGYEAGVRGYSAITQTLDGRGNVVEQAYLDESGKPARTNDGYAKVTSQYNARGHLIERAYFDESGKPMRSKNGCAKVANEYDDRGNLIETAYFDEAGKPARHKHGYAKVVNMYDDHGNRTDSTYFDQEGKPVRCRAIITEVNPGGRGERIGLKGGDILMTYDKKDVINASRFIDARRRQSPAEKPKELIILRNGKLLTFRIAPGLFQATLEDRVVPETELQAVQDEKRP